MVEVYKKLNIPGHYAIETFMKYFNKIQPQTGLLSIYAIIERALVVSGALYRAATIKLAD